MTWRCCTRSRSSHEWREQAWGGALGVEGGEQLLRLQQRDQAIRRCHGCDEVGPLPDDCDERWIESAANRGQVSLPIIAGHTSWESSSGREGQGQRSLTEKYKAKLTRICCQFVNPANVRGASSMISSESPL
ncbi:unnamed protein product [Urochloa humidicola]